MKRCPKCRTEVPDEARVCPKCPWIYPQDQMDEDGSAGVAMQKTPIPFALLLFGAVALFAGWHIILRTSDKEGAFTTSADRAKAASAAAAVAASLNASSTIVLYGPEEDQNTSKAQEDLKQHGLSASLVPVGDIDGIRAQGLLEKAQAAGVVSGSSLSLPFATVDGKVYSRQALEEALAQLPLSNADTPDR